jgi:hypothetical protein
MSDRKPCCQEAWEEGWLAGLKTAGEMLSFERGEHLRDDDE